MNAILSHYYSRDYPLATIEMLVRLMTPALTDDTRRVMVRSTTRTQRDIPLSALAHYLRSMVPNDGVHFEVVDMMSCMLIDVDFDDGKVMPAPKRTDLCSCNTERREICDLCWPMLALCADWMRAATEEFFGFPLGVFYTSGRRGFHAILFPPTGSPPPTGREELCHRLWHYPRSCLLLLCKAVEKAASRAHGPVSEEVAALQAQPWLYSVYASVVFPRFRDEWRTKLCGTDVSVADAAEHLRIRTLAHNAHPSEPPTHCLDCRINNSVARIRRYYTIQSNRTSAYEDDDIELPDNERWDIFLVLMRVCLFEVDERAGAPGHAFRLPMSPHYGSDGRSVAVPFDTATSQLCAIPSLQLSSRSVAREKTKALKWVIRRGCDYSSGS